MHDGPQFNDPIDRFTQVALQRNLSVELFNHPEGDRAGTCDGDDQSATNAALHSGVLMACSAMKASTMRRASSSPC